MPGGRFRQRLEDDGYTDPWDAYFINSKVDPIAVPTTPDWPTDGPPTPDPAPPESGGGGGEEGYGFEHFTPTPRYNPNYKIPNAPAFKAPKFDYQGRPIPEFNPTTKFTPPNPNEINLDPSYQWRLGQGQRALEQSAAGKGVLRSGGTLKNLLSYGQDMASQEFGNIYGRAADTYDKQYGQERDVYNARLGEYGLDFGGYETKFDRNYTGARDEYAPQFATWQAKVAAEQRAKDLELANMWAEWMHDNPSWSDYANTTKE